MTRRHLLACAFVTLAGALMVFWLSRPVSTVQGGVERWQRVEPHLLESQLGLVGRIHAGRQLILAAPFDGSIAALFVEDGQQVQSGETLMMLDTEGLEIQLREAQAQVLKAGEALRQMQGWQDGPEVAQARRAQDRARGALAVSQAELDDTRRLFDRGIVARMEVDNLIQQVRVQQQGVLEAEHALRLTRARGQGNDLRIAQMEMTNAQARWQALARMCEQRVIKAPFPALVARASHAVARPQRHLQVGQQVAQGQPLLALVDVGRLEVLAKVEEGDLGKLREGMSVEVRVAGQQLAGRVQRIALQAREDGGDGAWYDLVVSLDTPSQPWALGLRLGMSAQLKVVVHRSERGIAVAPESLRVDESGRTYVVYREAEGQPERNVFVEIGATVAEGVEVQGLGAGDVRMP
ncbi:HlyD family efflux transporter periplasmic adaptor subunit [Pseudomonas sp. SK2]|uniref:HlyD family secretion protein n=1 Tax=Pseudomonas sp. SK2 TaxID=2841063 RepID=UPI00192BA4E6|nr:HlyD family efflux transporter periplasmic adaptor subunit [Pseudomonas sp. SK2]QQZ37157.1 HlyD family efflux transporter periplasmic adaptor subunit [Pseudomonas sp. SK2]